MINKESPIFVHLKKRKRLKRHTDNNPMRKLLLSAALLAALFMSGCRPSGNRAGAEPSAVADELADTSAARVRPQYAQGFAVRYATGMRLVDIRDPQLGEGETYRFALIPRGEKPQHVPEGYTVIETPVRSVICMTTLQLSNFIKLGETEHVSGITSTRHLFNPHIRRQIEAGKTRRIGIEGNFNNEMVMALNPDLILISPYKRGGYDVLRDVNIPLVPHLGYKEMTPLAQAEWIKFVGLLLGEEEKANRMFAQIARRYNELKELTAHVAVRPVVFSGELHGGNWYAVGGRSFLAQLFRDAGADYFLKDNEASGGVTLDFETVYSQANKADYWRILNSYDGPYSYDALKAADERYADFKAFKERRILYCNLRETPYYEEMPTAPERLLADFVKAFHPELLPDYQPVFYKLLK